MTPELAWLNKALKTVAIIERYLLSKDTAWFEALFDKSMVDCTFIIPVAIHKVLEDGETRVLKKYWPKEWLEQTLLDVWEGLHRMPESFHGSYSANWLDALTAIKSSAYQKLKAAEALFRQDGFQRDNAQSLRLLQVLQAETLYPALTQKLYRLFSQWHGSKTVKRDLMTFVEQEAQTEQSICRLLYAPSSGDKSVFTIQQLSSKQRENIFNYPEDAFAILQLAHYFAWDSERLNAYCMAEKVGVANKWLPMKALEYLDSRLWPRVNALQATSTLQVVQYFISLETEHPRQAKRVAEMLNKVTADQALWLLKLNYCLNAIVDAVVKHWQQLATPQSLEASVFLALYRQTYTAVFIMTAVEALLQKILVKNFLKNFCVLIQNFCQHVKDVHCREMLHGLFKQELASIVGQFILVAQSKCNPPCQVVSKHASALASAVSVSPSSHEQKIHHKLFSLNFPLR